MSSDWRERLKLSRRMGTGFAAPGGEFTRALFEWSLTPEGRFVQGLLRGRRVVELGAGMMPYGFALAAHSRARNFVAVEPFFADRQALAQATFIKEHLPLDLRIPRKVIGKDMLNHLLSEPDEMIVTLACGIEDCIMPDSNYRKKVEGEIERTLVRDGFFISSHSDLKPKGLLVMECTFSRPFEGRVRDRLRLHGRKEAFDRWMQMQPKDSQGFGGTADNLAFMIK